MSHDAPCTGTNFFWNADGIGLQLSLFTELFTARVNGHPVGSVAGCGQFLTCFDCHERMGH